MNILAKLFLNIPFLFIALFMVAAIHYWAGDTSIARTGTGSLIALVLLYLWFSKGRNKLRKKAAALALIGLFFTAYALKKPISEDWVPLHQKTARIERTNNTVKIINFRDAIHTAGQPAKPIWIEQSFDLSRLTGAHFIMQPFGPSAVTVHIMMTFEFSDGTHLAASVEARRTNWDHFDPFAGLFRHDQLYLALGTERDLIWKRLARTDPYDLYFFPIEAPLDQIRTYLLAVLKLAQSLSESPRFYSTISDSCFSTLIKLAPGIDQAVPWHDHRRFIPGTAVSLLQELSIIDASLPEDLLIKKNKLKGPVSPPSNYKDGQSWSEHLRSKRS